MGNYSNGYTFASTTQSDGLIHNGIKILLPMLKLSYSNTPSYESQSQTL